MSARPYWIKSPPYSSMHKKVFSGKTGENCWAINLDKMPELGYCPVTDDEFERSKYVDGDIEHRGAIPHEEWIDPRKGDLFYLVDLLTRKPKVSENEPPPE